MEMVDAKAEIANSLILGQWSRNFITVAQKGWNELYGIEIWMSCEDVNKFGGRVSH